MIVTTVILKLLLFIDIKKTSMICKCRKLQRDTRSTVDDLYFLLCFLFNFLVQTFNFLVSLFFSSISEICVALLTIEGEYVYVFIGISLS